MRTAVTAALAALILASCVSAPPTTPQESAIAPATVGLSATLAPQVAADWWTVFRDPKLDALVAEALAGNPSLHAALARMRAAQAVLSENRAATWPQVNLDAQDQRERFSRDYIIPPPFGGQTQWIGQIEANLSWNIDIWGREAAMVDKARSLADASALDAEGARLALAGAVVNAYVELARTDTLTVIAQQTVTDRADTLAITRSRLRSGLDSSDAGKDAEALLSQAKEDLLRAEAARETQIHAMAALIGRGADAYATIAASVLPQPSTLALPATLPADLLARRTDILAAEARVEAAVKGREVARKAFYPDVNLLAFAGWQAIGLKTLFSGSSLTYGAGPAIHLPIFDAGELRAEYAGATADLDVAVADYNGAVLGAVKQTADALTTIRSLDDQRVEEARALADASDSFRIAETRYRNGLSNRLAVIQAENTLLRAREDDANINAGLATSRVALVVAIGGGFEPEQSPAARSVAERQDQDRDP